MRLIDADEAEARIDAKLNEFFAWGESDFGYRNACVAIKRMLISLPTVNEWIPCNKGLPKEDEQVFVYLFGDDPYIAWVNRNGKWETEHFECDEDEEPIAWMPLPKPFEVKER